MRSYTSYYCISSEDHNFQFSCFKFGLQWFKLEHLELHENSTNNNIQQQFNSHKLEKLPS